MCIKMIGYNKKDILLHSRRELGGERIFSIHFVILYAFFLL